MNSSELIKDLRSALDELKNNGNTSVPIDGLQKYLDEISRITQDKEINQSQQLLVAKEKFEYDFDVWKVKAPIQNAQELEMFKAVLETGLSALKSATLINGAAAIALLAFLGNVLSKSGAKIDAVQINSFSSALEIFVFGVFFAGVATGMRYLSQDCYAEAHFKMGTVFKFLAIILALASYVSFLIGSVVSVNAFAAIGR
jgi:hypothetical protein